MSDGQSLRCLEDGSSSISLLIADVDTVVHNDETHQWICQHGSATPSQHLNALRNRKRDLEKQHYERSPGEVRLFPSSIAMQPQSNVWYVRNIQSEGSTTTYNPMPLSKTMSEMDEKSNWTGDQDSNLLRTKEASVHCHDPTSVYRRMHRWHDDTDLSASTLKRFWR